MATKAWTYVDELEDFGVHLNVDQQMAFYGGIILKDSEARRYASWLAWLRQAKALKDAKS